MILNKIKEIYPDLNRVRIALDSVSDEARDLAIKLFEEGATIVVADKNREAVTYLNKTLFERSGSKFRYRTVPYGEIYKEPVEVLITFELEEEKQEVVNGTAKHRINARDFPSTDGKQEVKGKAITPATPVKPAIVSASVTPAKSTAVVPAASTNAAGSKPIK
jgi:hypothetical protein